MSDEPILEKAGVKLDASTRLAFERTYLAHEPTQMAWVRTALSLISFGFGIAKFFEYLHEKQGEQAPLLGARTVGILMIATGLAALGVAGVQHWKAMKILRKQCPDMPRSLATVTGGFLAFLGILALVGTVPRQ